MKQGQRVEVKLHGDDAWYPGEVIKAKKMWVQLDSGTHPAGEFIADECSISEWRIEERST